MPLTAYILQGHTSIRLVFAHVDNIRFFQRNNFIIIFFYFYSRINTTCIYIDINIMYIKRSPRFS